MIWKSPLGKSQNKKAEAMMREASALGRERFLEQRTQAIDARLNMNDALEFQQDTQDMLAIELPFMWGWFLAFAESQEDWPTTPDQRATLHVIQYCLDHHGMSFDQARGEGAALDAMWNEADPLFEAIQKNGYKAYQDPETPFLAQIISEIIDFRRGNKRLP